MNKRIVELDGLRAISVICVVIAHFTEAARVFPSYLRPALAGLGPLGVQVFFVISGFVITRLKLEEKRLNGKVSLTKFYLRRFFRIIPAYWTYLFVILLIAISGEISLNGACVITSLLFVSNFHLYTWPEMWFSCHSWTLSVEEQYYLILPFTMWVILQGNRAWILISVWFLYLFTSYSLNISFSTPLDITFLASFRFILAGVLLSLLSDDNFAKLKGMTILLPIALIIFLMAKTLLTGFPQLVIRKLATPTEAMAFAVIIGWLIQNPARCGLLRNSILQWIGKCSFSIYLWQQLYAGPREFYGQFKLSDPRCGVFLLIISASLSYYLIERNSIAFGKKLCSMF